MAVKFLRNYKLYVQAGKDIENFIVVEPPFTVEFDIVRTTLASASHAHFKLFNLSKSNRHEIRYDFANKTLFRGLLFFAGYGTDLSLIFQGNLNQAWSIRQGSNFITEIDVLNGGSAYTNARTNINKKSGQATNNTLVEDLIASMNTPELGNITQGKSSDFGNEPLVRGNSFSDSTVTILQDVTGNSFFIDNGKGFALKGNDCLPGIVTEINEASGIIGTPTLQQRWVVVEMLLEPQLVMGQIINLKSSLVDSDFNKSYKIVSLSHKGTISQAIAGEATTRVTLAPSVDTKGFNIL